MTEIVAPEPTPEQAALFARVRRLMLIAGLTTALAVAAVLIAVGYRLFRTEGSAVAIDATATLPNGEPPRLVEPKLTLPGLARAPAPAVRPRCAPAPTGWRPTRWAYSPPA